MKKLLIIFTLFLGVSLSANATKFCCDPGKTPEECCAERGKMYCENDGTCRTKCVGVTLPECIGGCFNPKGECCLWCPTVEVCQRMGKCQKIGSDGCYTCEPCDKNCLAPKCLNQDGVCCDSCPRVCPEGECLINLDGCYVCGECNKLQPDDDDDVDDDDECPEGFCPNLEGTCCPCDFDASQCECGVVFEDGCEKCACMGEKEVCCNGVCGGFCECYPEHQDCDKCINANCDTEQCLICDNKTGGCVSRCDEGQNCCDGVCTSEPCGDDDDDDEEPIPDPDDDDVPNPKPVDDDDDDDDDDDPPNKCIVDGVPIKCDNCKECDPKTGLCTIPICTDPAKPECCNNECYPKCPDGKVRNSETCACECEDPPMCNKLGTKLDEELCVCICDPEMVQECTSPQVWLGYPECECGCPPELAVNEENCPEEKPWDDKKCACSCPEGKFWVDEKKCCPYDLPTLCGETCCPNMCDGNACCPEGQECNEKCCSAEEYCADETSSTCCLEGETFCNGICCTEDEECCGGSCVSLFECEYGRNSETCACNKCPPTTPTPCEKDGNEWCCESTQQCGSDMGKCCVKSDIVIEECKEKAKTNPDMYTGGIIQYEGCAVCELKCTSDAGCRNGQVCCGDGKCYSGTTCCSNGRYENGYFIPAANESFYSGCAGTCYNISFTSYPEYQYIQSGCCANGKTVCGTGYEQQLCCDAGTVCRRTAPKTEGGTDEPICCPEEQACGNSKCCEAGYKCASNNECCYLGTHELCNGECKEKCPEGQTRNTTTCECECPEGKDKCNNTCHDKCPEGQVRNTETCACGCPEGEKDCGGWCCPNDNTCGNASTKQCCKDSLCCENGLKVLAAPIGTYDEEYGIYDYGGWVCMNCDGHLGCGTDVTIDYGGAVQFCGLNERVFPIPDYPGLGVCCGSQYNYGEAGVCCCTESCDREWLYDSQCNVNQEELEYLCQQVPDDPLCR